MFFPPITRGTWLVAACPQHALTIVEGNPDIHNLDVPHYTLLSLQGDKPAVQTEAHDFNSRPIPKIVRVAKDRSEVDRALWLELKQVG